MGANHSNGQETRSAGAEDEEVSFADFDVVRSIGRGSFGKVCIVRRRRDRRAYAMKYMNKMRCVERNAVHNVMREIDILVKLDHPVLVNLWYAFHDEEDMFLVFDLLAGGDLAYHLKHRGKMDEESVKLYLCELGLALDYLRCKRVIHRDVKPENVLLDERGHAHLSDFNVATVLALDTLATSVSGTRPYMAPEMFAAAVTATGDDSPSDHRSHSQRYCCPAGYSFPVDWWSLGVTCYQLLVGRRPFDAVLQSAAGAKEARDSLLSCSLAVPSNWSRDLVSLLLSLLRPDARKRLANLQLLQRHPYMADINFSHVLRKKTPPAFVPPADSLNYDPTYELEEMIVESRPLHNKKKRLLKLLAGRNKTVNGPTTQSQLQNHNNTAAAASSTTVRPTSSSTEAICSMSDQLSELNSMYKVYNRGAELKDETSRLQRLEEEISSSCRDTCSFTSTGTAASTPRRIY